MKRLSSLSTIAVVALAVFAASAAASHGKQYVLKHPKREHCKAHYVKKAETVKKREHHKTIKTKQTVCQYVAPKSTTPPTKTEPETKTTETPKAPIATITKITATATEQECKPVEGPSKKISICGYTVTYSTVNSQGEAVPGETVVKEHVPPSQEERKVAIPSGALVGIGWSASELSISSECSLNSTINKVEQPSYACEKQNPREILIAEYIPATGYLASQSEPVTLQ